MTTQIRKTILLATDHSGSVLNAIDTAGSNAIAYSAYGHSQLSASQSQIRFNGEFQELMTGYYSLGNGHRIYSPLLMRFLSPDYLSPFGAGGVNAYVYCGGDPRNRHDPSGKVYVYFKRFAIPRPTLKLAGRTSDKLLRTPTSTASKINSTFESASSISNRRSALSNHDAIKSYSSVDNLPSVPMPSPYQSMNQSSLSSIGPSYSSAALNPNYVATLGLTSNRAAHGATKSSTLKWVNSTNNIPDEQLDKFSQIPNLGAEIHTRERLAVQANGEIRGTELQRRAKRKLRVTELEPWLKY
ncbi:RHS repeat-associated core domain-containing protein [Pseudomonas sp. Sample_22]|jgi:RHS repeat-associated protein|uniref:RHS repeat-associated core domain-containing protein n=1 Tax=Pseudomonas sp. Sample_22 TaxID=2448266 RepID=UPI001032D5C6|nr:RHS repeat-associated core domain-containing protein [Pseudomonas sp. Sample_22]